ncbi:MAG: hypothetical protein ACFFDN_28995 [Candidatus Hodarchaeota archaeon]
MRSKYRNYIIVIYLTISFISFLYGSTYLSRQRILQLQDPIFATTNLIGSLLIVVLIEFAIIFGFLKSADLNKRDLFFSVLIVNLVIFLPTQTVAYLFLAFFFKFYPVYIITTFIIVLGLEWLLYHCELRKLLIKKPINKELSFKKILLISITANLTSGILTHIYPGIMLIFEIFNWPELYF